MTFQPRVLLLRQHWIPVLLFRQSRAAGQSCTSNSSTRDASLTNCSHACITNWQLIVGFSRPPSILLCSGTLESPQLSQLRLGPLEISSRAYYVMLGAGCNVFNENCSKGLLFPGFPPDLDSISRDEMEICLFARRELLYSALTCTGDLEEQGRGFGTYLLVQMWSYVWCRYSRSAHLIIYGKPTPHGPSGSRIMRRQPQTLEAGSLRRYVSDRIYEQPLNRRACTYKYIKAENGLFPKTTRISLACQPCCQRRFTFLLMLRGCFF